MELHGYAAVNGLVVLVGKATMEYDHGAIFWLCQTQPPHKQHFHSVTTFADAVNWLTSNAKAETVYSCTLVKG